MARLGAADASERGPRGPLALSLLALCALAAFAGFLALGTWQVQRLAWKRELIARVEQRVHAPAVAAPTPSEWPAVTAASHEYRHVRLAGVFLYEQQVLVAASTALGSGYWVMTPLRQDDGSLVLVNRGFVPAEACGRDGRCAPGPAGETTVTGLLRTPETKVFLRHNDPAHARWYARDVQAIARARGLGAVAPFFVDADADPAQADAWPRGGLTVTSFPNNHLSYLITWYVLALMVLAAAVYVGRHEYRLRRRAG
ncbi:SURF1 family protein [Dyella marensis]|uniref:SURF1 family protein n=1 Tax=Dyella marensis TaxID=500610 RepID=UPI0031CFA52D